MIDSGPLILLAALLAVEGTSVGQFMISRPLVAGFLAGFLVGDAAQGLLIGGLLELYYLPAVPIGGGRCPEPGPATVVAVGAAGLTAGPGSVAFGVFFGLALGLLGGWTQETARRLMTRLVPSPDQPNLVRRLSQVQWWGVAAAGIRGAALAAFGLWVASGLVPLFAPQWPLSAGSTILLLILAGCVSLGSVLAMLGGVRRRGSWLLAGAVAGIALGVLI